MEYYNLSARDVIKKFLINEKNMQEKFSKRERRADAKKSVNKKTFYQRSVFLNETSLLKALYLSTYEISKKWLILIRN